MFVYIYIYYFFFSLKGIPCLIKISVISLKFCMISIHSLLLTYYLIRVWHKLNHIIHNKKKKVKDPYDSATLGNNDIYLILLYQKGVFKAFQYIIASNLIFFFFNLLFFLFCHGEKAGGSDKFLPDMHFCHYSSPSIFPSDERNVCDSFPNICVLGFSFLTTVVPMSVAFDSRRRDLTSKNLFVVFLRLHLL